jgi:3-hydroxybutyrate dehydrogenase
MYKAKSGSVAYMGSVQAPYVTAKHGLLASAASSPRRAPNTMCVLTSTARASCARRWWTSKFPEQAKELGISEEDVTEHVMLKDTVDGEFTTTDVAEAVLFFADFKTNALTGQSLVVSHGWFME